MESRVWQDKLEEACKGWNYATPVFQISSDRRGGRTAWSSTVTVHGATHTARFWYDGKNVNNAKEDAAEVALLWLAQSAAGSSSNSPATSASSPATSRVGYW
ncbi:hypothetical protein BT67DRAFT_170767 [Trichocladium antarcticum]|uniref:DRBM domain-containing protein n=1 Tax=Trichocladium antarcticum TaxID=1450529 RepID=A0AAN6UDG2_9PEZI|nr:hypothetical protein BT67DRAFT_170767 [Trichocladium antarcticum]